MKKRKTLRVYTVLIYLFLYLPMLYLILFSFNTSKNAAYFEGFTFKWYSELVGSDLLKLLGNSVLLAVCASLLATLLGTTAAVGIFKMKKRSQNWIMTVTNIPMTNPDIVTGISLALLFSFFGYLFKTNTYLGFGTLLIAHVTFCLPYIVLSVMPKLYQMDNNLLDAALDLGCKPTGAFFRVVLPEILPGILSGMMMCFTYSLDDFIISYFVVGNDFTTLPLEIYNYVKKQISPTVYALFTLMFVIIMILLVSVNMIQSRQDKKREGKERKMFVQ